jgi:hypothetical protein
MFNDNNKPHRLIHQHPDGVIIFNLHHLHSFGIINRLHQIQAIPINQCMSEDIYLKLFFISMKYRTPWTELKPTSPSTTTGKANPTNNEPTKDLSANTRTQDALSKWTQNQFKDSSKDIDGRRKFFLFDF